MSRTATAMIRPYDAEQRAKISGWVFDQNQSGITPMIRGDMLVQLGARSLPTFSERSDRLLLEALRGQSHLGERFNISDPRFVAATYSKNRDEVSFLLRLLSDKGWAKAVALGGECEVLPQGYLAADALLRKTTLSAKAFVAMWFDDRMDDAYERGFQVAVTRAGYDPVRIDRLDHVNRIDDEIIVQIRGSAFVVADFTGHRAGVYFEAGFALGLSLPVIWTCRKDHMGDLHFDVRQYNCIEWEDGRWDDLSSRLQYRIEAIAGKGPKASAS